MFGWGDTLIILGLGSYLLPAMGLQFTLIRIFGDRPWVGTGFMAVGAALCLLGGGPGRRTAQ